jgi:hypothetical protein
MSFHPDNVYIDSLNSFLYNYEISTLMSKKNWNRNIAMAVYNKFREEPIPLNENEFKSLLNLYITDASGTAKFPHLNIEYGDNDYVILEKAYNILKSIYGSLMDKQIYKDAMQEPFDQDDPYAIQYKQTEKELRNTPTSQIEKMIEDEIVRPDLETRNALGVDDFDTVMKRQQDFNLPYRGGKKKYKKYRKSRRKSKRKYRKSKRLNKYKKSKSKK